MRSIVTMIVAGAVASSASAGTTLFDFDSLQHGEIVINQFEPALAVSGVNFNRSFDIVAGFDTTLTGTADDDLEGPPWDGGNLAVDNTVLGVALILAENNTGADDGVLDNPDDEGQRPAGTITFEFASAINSFGFDIIDIEGVVVEGSSLDFSLGGNLVGSVDFTDFVTMGSGYFDGSVVFGNNHANRINPITAAQIGGSFDEVTLNLGGSGAIDNILIPAPGATALIGLGGLLMARRRR